MERIGNVELPELEKGAEIEVFGVSNPELCQDLHLQDIQALFTRTD